MSNETHKFKAECQGSAAVNIIWSFVVVVFVITYAAIINLFEHPNKITCCTTVMIENGIFFKCGHFFASSDAYVECTGGT